MPELDPIFFPPVAPPPLSPPVINLVTSARNPEMVDPETGDPIKWQWGFGFLPVPNQDPQIFDPRQSDNEAEQPVNPQVNTVPWWAEVEDTCSSFGFKAHDWIKRALAGLAAATPKSVEKEFWSGELAQLNGWPNLFLSMPAVAARADGFGPIIVNPTPGTPVSIVEGFELLEGAIGDCGAGARGMIHAAPQATPNFLGVRREGNLLLTMRDTIVTSGSGYSGEGPVGAAGAAPTATTSWLYGTGIPMVALDDPYVESSGDEVQILTRPAEIQLPGVSRTGDVGDDPLRFLYEAGMEADRLDATFRSYFLDRATNTVKARARRVVAATWDGVCHFACLVDITA